MQKSEKIEIHKRIKENIYDVDNRIISIRECILKIMDEIELAYHKARAEVYKEIIIDLKKNK